MSALPRWFDQLRWSKPVSVAALAQDRSLLPEDSGCYVFTADAAGLRPGAVLYVGKARRLRSRVGGYLVDWRVTHRTRHKGRMFIFDHRDRHGDHAIFVRWTVYGGRIEQLETNLCELFCPDYTDRWEEHELWDDEESLDAALLG